MTKLLSALCFASALLFTLPTHAASPAPSVAFPSLTTIYVGSGVFDSGDVDNAGTATTLHCSNVSGVAVQVRILILGQNGGVEGANTDNVAHGATLTRSTHLTAAYQDLTLATGGVSQGVVNVESTNSGVFCTALTINASINTVEGVPIRLVRVNGHPGVEE